MNAEQRQDVSATVMAMERAALDRWSRGDPLGFVENSAPDVTVFDPYLDRKINNREELGQRYEMLRDKIPNQGYEVVDPQVQEIGAVAILTYIWVIHELDGDKSMNVTAVYRNDAGRWQIAHAHVSLAKG